MIKVGSWIFEPSWRACLVAALALAFLLGLGSWQVQRLAWKTGLIAELAERGAAEAIALPPAFRPEDLVFQRIALSGRFLPAPEFRSAPRNRAKRPGYFLYRPFELDDGRQIIIEQGWLPQRPTEPVLSSEANPLGGPVRLEAILLQDGWQGSDWLRPANDPDGNVWHYVDALEMAVAAELSRPVPGVYAVLLPGQLPGDYPQSREPGVELPNNHLEYALTWFSLAGIMAVIFVLLHSRRDGSNRDGLEP